MMEDKNQNTNLISCLLCIVSSVLKKWRVILLVGCLCAICFDVIKTITFSPQYSAKCNVAIVDSDGKGIKSENASKAMKSIQYLLNSQYMKDIVNKDLNQDYFIGNIHTYLTPDTNFCTIEVISSTQKDAYFELDSLIRSYKNVSKRSSFGYEFVTIDNIQFYNVPLNNNNHKINYCMGLITGSVLCMIVYGLLSYFKDNIKDAKEINDKIDVKLFAKVPKERKQYQKPFSSHKQAILVNHFRTGFSYVESMNKLASKIEENYKKYQYQTILITSSLENEGKSSLAVNLALTLSKNKHKVLLIDGDLRKPSLHKIFEYQPQHYLSEILNNNQKCHHCITHLKKEKIDIIFSNTCLNSQELLSQFSFQEFFHELKKEYDYIIIDSAPSRFIADTSMIATYCDSTYIVVKQNDATCKVINDTIYHLTNTSANIVGTIYNASVYNPFQIHSLYGYRYGYRYGYYRYNKEKRG